MASTLTLEFEFRNRRFKDAAKGLKTFYQVLKRGWDGSAKPLSEELREFLDSVAEALANRHAGAWPGATTPKTLSRRSGSMINSILSSVKVDGQTFDTIRGTIGGSMVARVQEFGATITPKKAKFLTIPLKAALNSNGTPIKKSAREWSNTFVAMSKAGNLIIFQRRGAQVVPLYVLKTSVTIPPRLGMKTTLDVGLPYFVDRTMDRMVKEVLAQTGGSL